MPSVCLDECNDAKRPSSTIGICCESPFFRKSSESAFAYFPVSPVSPLVPLRVHHRRVRNPSGVAYPREYLARLADGGDGESWRRLQSDYRVFDRAALGSRRCPRDFRAKHVVAGGRCDLSVAAPAVCERRASVGVFVLWLDVGQVSRGSEVAGFGVSWVNQLLLMLGEYCVGRRRKGSMIGRLSWWEC